MKNFLIAAALSSSIFASGYAGAADGVPSAKVRYADLDLSVDAGSEILFERLKVAARSVCREWDARTVVFSDLKPTVEQYQRCLDKAIIGAVTKIDRPAFTSYVSKQMALPAASAYVRVAAK